MDVTLEQVAAQVSDVARHVTEVAKQLAEVKHHVAQVDKHVSEVNKHVSESEQRLTKHVDAAKADLKHQAKVYKEQLKEEGRKAAEGYGGTLEGIERELADLNKKVDTKFGDHDLVLADHNQRITILERGPA